MNQEIPKEILEEIKRKEKALAEANVRAAEAIVQLEESQEQLNKENKYRISLERAIRKISHGVFSSPEKDKLKALVNILAQTLKVDCAFICIPCSEEIGHMKIKALWIKDHFEEEFTYPIANTPCEKTFGGKTLCFPDKVQDHFPHGPFLKNQTISSYCATPLFDSEHNPTGILGIMHSKAIHEVNLFENILDLFSLKASDELERLNLERQSQDSHEQFMEAQKMEAIGKLAGGVAHEFNNLLGGILGYASILHEKIKDDNQVTRKLDLIIKSSKRGAELTQKLLGFARKGNYKKDLLDGNLLVQEGIDLLKPSLPKNIDIKTNLDPQLWWLEADGTRIVQSILNLGINARDALPQGGSIYFSSKNVFVDERLAVQLKGLKPGKYIQLSVEDNGIGIPKKIQNKIFEPFFTTKDIGKGTGLGLSMIFGIINRMKGHITVYSDEGFGTVFNLYLPASEQKMKDQRSDVMIQEHNRLELDLNSKTCLVADDDEIMRLLAKDILESLNATVTLVNNGNEALERIKNENFDFILLDIIMPELNGTEVLDQIKDDLEQKKILLSSGFYENDKIDVHLIPGQVGFIQKPYTRKIMLEALKELNFE